MLVMEAGGLSEARLHARQWMPDRNASNTEAGFQLRAFGAVIEMASIIQGERLSVRTALP